MAESNAPDVAQRAMAKGAGIYDTVRSWEELQTVVSTLVEAVGEDKSAVWVGNKDGDFFMVARCGRRECKLPGTHKFEARIALPALFGQQPALTRYLFAVTPGNTLDRSSQTEDATYDPRLRPWYRQGTSGWSIEFYFVSQHTLGRGYVVYDKATGVAAAADWVIEDDAPACAPEAKKIATGLGRTLEVMQVLETQGDAEQRKFAAEVVEGIKVQDIEGEEAMDALGEALNHLSYESAVKLNVVITDDDLAADAKFLMGDRSLEVDDFSTEAAEGGPSLVQMQWVAAGRPWDGGQVSYCVDPALSQGGKDAIAAAVAEIEANSCLVMTQIQWQTADRCATTGPAIAIRSSGVDGCANLGTVTVGMNFECCNVINLDTQCHNKGTTVHELLHALGMEHEHKRPDRDTILNVNQAAIDTLDRQNPTLQVKHQFAVDPNSYTGGAYDVNSVMQYSGTIMGQTTMTMKDGSAVHGQRVGMSPGDVEQLKDMYCRGKETPFATNGCWEWKKDYGNWMVNFQEAYKDGVTSPDQCQELCQQKPGCQYWTLFLDGAKRCQMMDQKDPWGRGNTAAGQPERPNAVSGPRTCPAAVSPTPAPTTTTTRAATTQAPTPSPGPSAGGANDSCRWNNDNFCDEDFGSCDAGTDCTDCGNC